MPLSADAILVTAFCTEEPSFPKFYNKPIAVTNQISLAILDVNDLLFCFNLYYSSVSYLTCHVKF